MSKACVFGSFVVDLMARTPHLPAPGETVRGSMFRMGAGGKGFNQAVAAHKAGADVTVITKLGRDSFADVALSTMKELGMDESRVMFSDEDPTGIALITVDESTGQNEIVVVPGALNRISHEEVDAFSDVLKDSEYVLLQLEIDLDADLYAAKLAHDFGCRVILNSAPYAPVSDEFYSYCWMVTPNEVEAEELSGIKVTDEASAKKAADFFHAKGVEAVLITLGGNGVYLSYMDREELIPAFKVDAIDTTGAGDAFSGGLLAGLSEGKTVEESVRFGQAVAALSVQKLGTTPSMPCRDAVDAFLKEHSR